MFKLIMKAVRRAVCDLVVLSVLFTALPAAIGRMYPDSGAERLAIVSYEKETCGTAVLRICGIPIRLGEDGERAVGVFRSLLDSLSQAKPVSLPDAPESIDE